MANSEWRMEWLGSWEAGKPESLLFVAFKSLSFRAFKLSSLLASKLPSFLAALVFTFFFSLLTPSLAFDRSNVPLKNWGGFAVQRSWVYDALEKIVLAGLTEEVIFNTKPLTRVEAARIVAQAVRRVTEDQHGDFNHRGYLEDLVYRLVEEFSAELAEMGIRTPLNREAKTEFLGLTPIDHFQFGSDFSERSQRVINSLGRRVAKGPNPATTLDGRIRVGDFLSFYYEPEFSWDKDGSQGRLLNGYGKLTLWNHELLVGRDSIWWGPGYRGSMSFSNNALPLDQVRFSSAEPWRLRWPLSYLGPVKGSLFVAQLEENRDFPHTRVSGWRLSMAPFRYLELGFNRMFQFGGRRRGSINPADFLELLVTQGSDNPNSRKNVNNVMSFDATLRIPDIQRYIYIVRDASFYFDFGWDDTLFGLIVPDKPGGIVGTYLAGVLGDPKLDLRFEYARTSKIQFTHSIYRSGFTNRGSILSHFIGTKGTEIFARSSRWISRDLLLGFQVGRAEIGSPDLSLREAGAPREKRQFLGFDFSYRLTDRSSFFLGYEFAQVKDRRFIAGKSGNDNFVRFEFTRSFGK